MIILNLKKKFKLYYEVKVGDLVIMVVNFFKFNGMGFDVWNIVIEFYNGNEDDYIYINEYFCIKK